MHFDEPILCNDLVILQLQRVSDAGWGEFPAFPHNERKMQSGRNVNPEMPPEMVLELGNDPEVPWKFQTTESVDVHSAYPWTGDICIQPMFPSPHYLYYCYMLIYLHLL